MISILKKTLLWPALCGWSVAAPEISEFLAVNINEDPDPDGHHVDWIEIHNPDGESLKLNGWYLTDNPENPTKWKLPGQASVPAGGYMQVYASSKDRGGLFDTVFHTNFLLESNTGYLALLNPDGEVVSEYKNYPKQIPDVSYGTVSGEAGYFVLPTPGEANGTLMNAPPAKAKFTQNGQAFYGSMQVDITCATQDARIRYTLDGSEPQETLFNMSPLYEGPITVDSITRIRARSFMDGSPPGELSEETYVKLADSLKDFTSDLPIVIVHSFDVNVDSKSRDGPLTPVSTVFLDRPTDGGRVVLDGEVDYSGRAGLRLRGQSSSGFAKKQYRLETWNDYETDKDVSLFGFPAESDWILHAPYTDKTLMRNYLSYNWFREMGNTAVRTKYCELFRNFTDRDEITYADYWGVYILMEKISRDGDRVDIAKLGYSDNSEPEITGGYIFRKDKEPEKEITFTTSTERQVLQLMEPKDPTPAQEKWIADYVDEFEEALHGQNSADPDVGYAKYIDVPSFIDTHILVEITKNIDGYRLSNYMHKDRNGKMVLGPAWDYNLSLGNADYLDGWKPDGWYYRLVSANQYPWFKKLFEDPEFELQYMDRWFELRRGMFATDQLMARIDEVVAEIDEGQERNFTKWNRLGVYDWPNAPGVENRDTYEKTVGFMRDWLTDRVDWMDGEFSEPPALETDGGQVDAGYQFRAWTGSLFRGGDVYYTLDGSDPRGRGGEILGTLVENNMITVTESSTVKARVRETDGTWSAYNSVSFIVGEPASSENLIVSEIMYHPSAPTAEEEAAGFTSRSEFEYIELLNVSNVPVELTGVSFTNGIGFDFDDATIRQIEPGARLLVVRNTEAFKARYGDGYAIAGSFGNATAGKLSNGGETVAIESGETGVIAEFDYDDDTMTGWPAEADGLGKSLVRVEEVAGADLSAAAAWTASANAGGSPGSAEDDTTPGGFATWKQEVFTAGELADSTISGDDADADGDQLATLVEYAFGTNPLDPDNAGKITVGLESATNNLLLSHTRNTLATDVDILVEMSSDLRDWEAATMENVSSEPAGDDLEAVVLRLNADSARYLRMRVSVQQDGG